MAVLFRHDKITDVYSYTPKHNENRARPSFNLWKSGLYGLTRNANSMKPGSLAGV